MPIGLTAQFGIAGVVVAWGVLAVLTPARASYTLAGIPLLSLAARYPAAAWQIAITLTYSAFAIDYHKAAFVSAPLVAWIVARWRSARSMFLLLLGTAVMVSLLKGLSIQLTTTHAVFVLIALLCQNRLDHLSRDTGQPGVESLILNREA